MVLICVENKSLFSTIVYEDATSAPSYINFRGFTIGEVTSSCRKYYEGDVFRDLHLMLYDNYLRHDIYYNNYDKTYFIK